MSFTIDLSSSTTGALAGSSGPTSWMYWLRKPRLNSAVQIVAVLTVFSRLR